ncbi:hypothetical protein IGI04_023445 [Brassica rapa subsp. trilocularis]|uniref:Uncharacterized protein n=1 Tax=Brassica rapa subsp. trilocularis TaxID=1813537 RepID=A0ABQ7M3V0_BRACM|nr:hypothetical protein IGI04_023445 [Brassica rapa subsp. trilocularis]
MRNHLALKTEEGPRPGGQGPVTGGRNQDPRGRDLEDRSWSNLFMEYFSPTVCPLFSGFICTCTRCERICSLVGDDLVNTLRVDITIVRYQVGPATFFFSFIRMRHCPTVGICRSWQKFRPDISLRFLRLSGSTNRVEECMGQDPGILRGRILARLRIRRTKRLNKTRRPKLRILMLDSTGLACASRAYKFFRGCDRRLYRLSSRNLEAGGTLVKEPVACMDLSPGTLRGPSRISFRLEVVFVGLFGAVSSFASSSYPSGSLKDGTRCVRLQVALRDRRCNGRILGLNETLVLLQNQEMLLGPEGVSGARRLH